MTKIALGTLVKDRLSGYSGHATGRLEQLHGSTQLKVEALKDGAVHIEWLDEARCEPVDVAITGFGTPHGREAA